MSHLILAGIGMFWAAILGSAVGEVGSGDPLGVWDVVKVGAMVAVTAYAAFIAGMDAK